MTAFEYGVYFEGDGNVLEMVRMVAHIVNVLKATELHTVYFFFISWRLITLQYCSGFCHTLKCTFKSIHLFLAVPSLCCVGAFLQLQ